MEIYKAGGIDRVAAECPDLLIKYPRGFLVLDERLRKPSKEYRKKEVSEFAVLLWNWLSPCFKVYVLYGPSELGKSQWAFDHYPDAYEVPSPQRGSWWFDKYEGQEEVVIDEYGTNRDELFGWNFFLKILDGRLIQVPYKGGHYWFKPKVIVITSNIHPREWYRDQDWRPLERRITHLFEFTSYKSYTIHKRPGQNGQGEGPATLIPYLQGQGPVHQGESSRSEEAQSSPSGVPTTSHNLSSSTDQISPSQYLNMEDLLLSQESLDQQAFLPSQ